MRWMYSLFAAALLACAQPQSKGYLRITPLPMYEGDDHQAQIERLQQHCESRERTGVSAITGGYFISASFLDRGEELPDVSIRANGHRLLKMYSVQDDPTRYRLDGQRFWFSEDASRDTKRLRIPSEEIQDAADLAYRDIVSELFNKTFYGRRGSSDMQSVDTLIDLLDES